MLLSIAAAAASDREPLDLREPAPVVDLAPTVPPGWKEMACTACHEEVAAEWAVTAHAVAWEDEVYRKELAARKRPELCHGCHAPEPLLAEGAPPRRVKARAESVEPRHFGISCESCHLGPDGTVLGPRGATTSAHASEASAFLTRERSNELCASCHQTNIGPVIGIAKDFMRSDLGEQGLSCVGCHMAPVERVWGTAEGEEVPSRVGRSHAIQTPRDPAFLAQAFRVELADPSKGIVRIHNRAGHRVPGLIGREIRFTLSTADTDAETELVIDSRSYLPLGEFVELGIGGGTADLRVVGLHVDPRHPDPIPFLDRTLTR